MESWLARDTLTTGRGDTMPESSPLPRRQGLSETELREVLDRAIELERTGDVVPVEEVERIAVEAGIDPRAVALALNELFERREMAPNSGSIPAAPASQGRLQSLISQPLAPVITGVLGAAAGSLTAVSLINDMVVVITVALSG